MYQYDIIVGIKLGSVKSYFFSMSWSNLGRGVLTTEIPGWKAIRLFIQRAYVPYVRRL